MRFCWIVRPVARPDRLPSPRHRHFGRRRRLAHAPHPCQALKVRGGSSCQATVIGRIVIIVIVIVITVVPMIIIVILLLLLLLLIIITITIIIVIVIIMVCSAWAGPGWSRLGSPPPTSWAASSRRASPIIITVIITMIIIIIVSTVAVMIITVTIIIIIIVITMLTITITVCTAWAGPGCSRLGSPPPTSWAASSRRAFPASARTDVTRARGTRPQVGKDLLRSPLKASRASVEEVGDGCLGNGLSPGMDLIRKDLGAKYGPTSV
jgi:hypothetical protein